jgi:hypothetical protein
MLWGGGSGTSGRRAAQGCGLFYFQVVRWESGKSFAPTPTRVILPATKA